MELKVSDLIANFFEEKKIDLVFGIIGAGNAHLFDAITRKGYTQIVCVHHEQAAAMAMQTYFRTTGKITACLLTTGAGSTNGITGVVSAWMDSIPGLIISGNENSKFTTEENHLRIWGVQGYDSVEMVKEVTKYAARVMDPTLSKFELDKAYSIASTGRPGPVWLDIPMNIQAMNIDSGKLVEFIPDIQKEIDQSEKIQNLIVKLKSAKRPLLWLGHGIRLAEASELVVPLLEKLKIPALVSWAGIDIVDSDHPLVFGRAGVYGQRSANFVLQNCDFLLTIGTRLAIPQIGYDIAELARAAEIAVVDIDCDEAIKHTNRISMPICMDAKKFITLLAKDWGNESSKCSEWINQCNNYRRDYPWVGPEHSDTNGYINSYKFMERLCDYLKPNQIIVTDMGTALLSGHQVLKIKKGQRLMTSTGLGEMGYGLPAAVGAAFGDPKAEVVCLNCDGGMMMNLQELQTIVHHQLPIKIIIFNNEGYLMIKHTQKALFEGRETAINKSTGMSCPDYTKVATAFGINSYQIRTWSDFETVMPKVQNETGPVICEVFMDPEQLFVPKLGLVPQKDGSIVSPPLEDLSPLLSREAMRKNMIIGLHPKSEHL
jgi:acetolactate synthase-1/2/3 large subunit